MVVCLRKMTWIAANLFNALKDDDEEISTRNSSLGSSWAYMFCSAPGANNSWFRSCTEVIHVKPGGILRTCDVVGGV